MQPKSELLMLVFARFLALGVGLGSLFGTLYGIVWMLTFFLLGKISEGVIIFCIFGAICGLGVSFPTSVLIGTVEATYMTLLSALSDVDDVLYYRKATIGTAVITLIAGFILLTLLTEPPSTSDDNNLIAAFVIVPLIIGMLLSYFTGHKVVRWYRKDIHKQLNLLNEKISLESNLTRDTMK